jgi:anti-sigma B factor antagonist
VRVCILGRILGSRHGERTSGQGSPNEDEGRVADTADTNEPTGLDRLAVSCATVDGITVVTVSGEIDYHTSGLLREALTPEDPTTTARTVADLTGVAFMDSSGINALVAAHQAHGPGGWLRLAGVRTSVLRTLEIVGLTDLLDCYPSVSAAVAG